MKKVILVSGPPKSGKDTSAQYILENLKDGGIHYKYAFPLKNMVHAMYGLNVPHDFFESRKSEPCEELEGRVPRQEYIRVSEKLVKPAYGKDFFGRIGANVIFQHTQNNCVVVSDFGFKEELLPLLSKINRDDILGIQLHREGCTFEGDSRSYIDTFNYFDTKIIVANNKETLYNELDKIIGVYFG